MKNIKKMVVKGELTRSGAEFSPFSSALKQRAIVRDRWKPVNHFTKRFFFSLSFIISEEKYILL